MKARAIALRHQRAALIAQIDTERIALARQGAALRPAALTIDKIITGIRYVKSHPSILLLPVVILSLLQPRRLLAYAISGLGAWRLMQRVRIRLRT